MTSLKNVAGKLYGMVKKYPRNYKIINIKCTFSKKRLLRKYKVILKIEKRLKTTFKNKSIAKRQLILCTQ